MNARKRAFILTGALTAFLLFVYPWFKGLSPYVGLTWDGLMVVSGLLVLVLAWLTMHAKGRHSGARDN